jgi:2'-5' RNA ligase
MHGIISVLDEVHYAMVAALWDELELDCGMTGIQATPIPHFSWQVAQDYDFDALRLVLEKMALRIPPFRVQTTGLGMFSGPRPVLFIPVVRDEQLSSYHRQLWESLVTTTDSSSRYYRPEMWMPHITLGFGDFNADAINCALQDLLSRSFDWEIEVDNLALVVQQEQQVGELLYRLPLTGAYA